MNYLELQECLKNCKSIKEIKEENEKTTFSLSYEHKVTGELEDQKDDNDIATISFVIFGKSKIFSGKQIKKSFEEWLSECNLPDAIVVYTKVGNCHDFLVNIDSEVGSITFENLVDSFTTSFLPRINNVFTFKE